jgi:hypothetical protein
MMIGTFAMRTTMPATPLSLRLLRCNALPALAIATSLSGSPCAALTASPFEKFVMPYAIFSASVGGGQSHDDRKVALRKSRSRSR